MTSTPSVGWIVHYVSHGSPVRPDGTQAYTSQCRAAIITEVTRDTVATYDGTGRELARHDQPWNHVGLCVLNPTGQFFNQGVRHDDGEKQADGDITALCDGLDHDGGTWHWPARVDEDTARSAARGNRSLDRR